MTVTQSKEQTISQQINAQVEFSHGQSPGYGGCMRRAAFGFSMLARRNSPLINGINGSSLRPSLGVSLTSTGRGTEQAPLVARVRVRVNVRSTPLCLLVPVQAPRFRVPSCYDQEEILAKRVKRGERESIEPTRKKERSKTLFIVAGIHVSSLCIPLSHNVSLIRGGVSASACGSGFGSRGASVSHRITTSESSHTDGQDHSPTSQSYSSPDALALDQVQCPKPV